MERQLGSRTLPSTAPRDGRLRGGSLTCLHQALDHGLGGVRRVQKNLCCGSLKRDPHGPFYIILKALSCYDFENNIPASFNQPFPKKIRHGNPSLNSDKCPENDIML
jgi:hypothetical protein